MSAPNRRTAACIAGLVCSAVLLSPQAASAQSDVADLSVSLAQMTRPADKAAPVWFATTVTNQGPDALGGGQNPQAGSTWVVVQVPAHAPGSLQSLDGCAYESSSTPTRLVCGVANGMTAEQTVTRRFGIKPSAGYGSVPVTATVQQGAAPGAWTDPDPTDNTASVVGVYDPSMDPPVNHAPVARCDRYRVKVGGTLTVPAAGVMANDTDADGDPVAATVTWTSFARKKLTLKPDGSFKFKAGPQRRDAAFFYRVHDSKGAVSGALVRLGIGQAPPDCSPDGDGKSKDEGKAYRARLIKIECLNAAGGTVRAKVTYRMWSENDDLVEKVRAKARLVPAGSRVGNQLRSFGKEARFETHFTDFDWTLWFYTSTVNPDADWDVHVRFKWVRSAGKDVGKNRYHHFNTNNCK